MSEFQHTYSGGETQCSHCGGWTRGANLRTECPTRLRAEVERLRSEVERLREEAAKERADVVARPPPEGYPANNKKFAEKVQEQLRRDDKADQFRSNMSRFATSLRKDSSAQNLMDEHQMDNIQRGEHRRREKE